MNIEEEDIEETIRRTRAKIQRDTVKYLFSLAVWGLLIGLVCGIITWWRLS